jgi:site-specific DNA-methyltransferase (adenine-specific)
MRVGNNVLIHSDCFVHLVKLPSASVDAVLTDPPYLAPQTAAAAGGRRQNNKEGSDREDATIKNVGDFTVVEAAFRAWFGEILRVLKPDGRVFLFCDGITHSVILRACYGKFYYTSTLVWDKDRFGMGGEFTKQTELIFYGRRARGPVVQIHNQADILRFKPVPSAERLHPAEKPIELLKSLLRYCGPVVLDPFAGSGAVLEACAQTGHKGIGIEIDEVFYNAAVQRLQGAAR